MIHSSSYNTKTITIITTALPAPLTMSSMIQKLAMSIALFSSTALGDTSTSTCDEIGWSPTARGIDDTVCSNSIINGTCSGTVTYNDALAFCNAVGARLCTMNELATNEARNLGCNLDKTLVWSSNECGGDGIKTAYGSSIVPLNGTCVNTTTTAAYDVRCCADTVVDVVTATPSAAPSSKPVPAPTVSPSAVPVIEVVTAAPTSQPVPAPTAAPSAAPIPSVNTGSPVSAPTPTPESSGQGTTGDSKANSAEEDSAGIQAEDSDDFFSTNTITIASISLVGIVAVGVIVGGGIAYKAKQHRAATGQPDGNNDVEMAGM